MSRSAARAVLSLTFGFALVGSVGCSADAANETESDAEERALSSRCNEYGYVTPNTHSTDGHAMCFSKRANGLYDVKCMDGRRTTTGDYGVALRFCNVNKPSPPPAPSATVTAPPTTPACRIFSTFECWADKNDGVCIYDCGGTRTSVFASCSAPGKKPVCPPQP